MGPLERLPENALEGELKRRATEANELKGSFQSLGASSVVPHRVFSSAVYDTQFTSSSVEGTLHVHRADIEFVPDDMTFGGAFAHRLYARVMDTSNNSISSIAPMVERRVTRDGRQIWSFYHVSFGYPEDSIRLKFYFFTTGSGTFTASIVN